MSKKIGVKIESSNVVFILTAIFLGIAYATGIIDLISSWPGIALLAVLSIICSLAILVKLPCSAETGKVFIGVK
ncbi:MAG: hypothetical protein ACI9TY_001382 [Alphaproteobacteria bacterium]|jgi:hypothetical protein